MSSNKVIITHPDNLHLLRDMTINNDIDKQGQKLLMLGAMYSFPIRTDPHIPKDEWKGEYRLPDRTIIHGDKFSLRTKWITYGPEDISYLEYARIIQKAMRPVFYVMDVGSVVQAMQEYSKILDDAKPSYPVFGMLVDHSYSRPIWKGTIS